MMFRSLVENSPQFMAIAADGGTLLYVNAAGCGVIGAQPADFELRTETVADLFAQDDLPYVREVIMADLKRDGRWEGNFRLRDRRSGSALPVHLAVYAIHDAAHGGSCIAFVGRDITASRRSDLRLRFLLDAGAALSQSLDFHETFATLTKLVVDAYASYCVIDLFSPSENGRPSIERVAASHVDWKGTAFLEMFGSFVSVVESTTYPVAQAISDGVSSLMNDIDDTVIDRIATSNAQAVTLKALKLRSFVTVPLSAGGEIVGALSCALAHEAAPRSKIPRAYDAEDLFFIEELGRRAGAFLWNARLYARERRIADSLQSASLPRSLPRLRGIEIDADYRPGSTEATIGGDWYDAFELGDGRIAITIGDVVGHGLGAAIMMTKLRQSMQAAALVDPDPDTMLQVANKTIKLHDPDSHATALAGVLDPSKRTFTFACAGHPGPLLRTGDGTVTEFQSGGSLLGLTSGGRFTSKTFAVPPGSTLVVFTDGLVEQSRDITHGYGRLSDALNDERILGAPGAARAIADSVLASETCRDDVAVLVVRLDVEITRPDEREIPSAVAREPASTA